MGMYTELVLKCRIKDNVPAEVTAILNHLFNNAATPTILPTHLFFACDRWNCIGRCCSYYHVPFATSKFDEGYLFSRSDLKDYNEEIAKFIDWLRPYLDHEPDKVIGWSWYEGDSAPTLLRAGDPCSK